MKQETDRVDVIVAGHLCLDLIPEMAHISLAAMGQPGRLLEVGPLLLSTGGAVSNTGLALHRLGIDVRLMACVGDDFVGRAITNFIDSRSPVLSRHIVTKPAEAGSYTIVLSPEKVDRIFLHAPSTNATFGVQDIDFSLVSDARIFHLGYPPILPRLIANDGEELLTIFQRAKSSGVVTSMDTCLPDPAGLGGEVNWKRILNTVLPFTDIFVPSIEEILYMLRQEDYQAWRQDVLLHLTDSYLEALADELIDMGVVIGGFKLGQMGFYLQGARPDSFIRLQRLPLDVSEWAACRVWTPAFEVEVVGTTGAGDSAYAGLLGALLRGLSPQEAGRWACAVGACNVEAADATSGVRAWDAIQERLDLGWPVRSGKLSRSL